MKVDDGSIFFIVGSGRCGTTLLRAILDARNDVSIPGETHFFTTYKIQNLIRYMGMSERNYKLAVSEYPQWRHVKDEDIDWEIFREVARSKKPSWESLIISFLEAFRRTHDSKYVGEKTPGHIRRMKEIKSRIPNAQFLHLIRDPRAVVASYLKHDLYARTYGRSVVRASYKWKEALDQHEWACQFLGEKSYMPIKYEDLVRNPEAVLKDINEFLGLPEVEDAMSRYLGRKVSVTNESNHEGVGKPVFTSSLNAWSNELSVKEIALVETICSKGMKGMSYEKSEHRISYFSTFFHLVGSFLRFSLFAIKRLATRK